MTTIPAKSKSKARPLAITGVMAVLAIIVGAVFIVGTDNHNSGEAYPNLTLNDAAVTCATAHDVQNVFAPSMSDATKATPDYSGVARFGFAAPVNPVEIAPLQGVLKARLTQIDQKVKAVDSNTCTNTPTASVTNADGQTVVLPVVDGSQPDQPITGSDSNKDSRTVPVTIGDPANGDRTNTWSDLDGKFGQTSWYTSCANDKLGMNWPTDVPKYEATEDQHDNRFILAINTTWTDDQIKAKAAKDGNPRVNDLQIVRVPSIINTRHLEGTECDPFVDKRSIVRVSLGKVVFDDQGQFKDLDQTKGIFVDCHNMWEIPKTPPVPTTPGQTPPPGTTPHGTTPGTTPPVTTTTQPPGCTNGGVPPQCLERKDGNAGAGSKSNAPTSILGTAPPDPTLETRPPNPTTSYKAPAPPPPPPPTSHSVPPVETTASGPPATGTHCPPGIPTC